LVYDDDGGSDDDDIWLGENTKTIKKVLLVARNEAVWD
jgi:hypothetical protein